MISTHVLDLHRGAPAENVSVVLERTAVGGWQTLREARTDSDGRIAFTEASEAGVYRLTFAVKEYLHAQGHSPFFVEAPVTFEISDVSRKYHIPLLLSPYGYSTYRGS